MEREEPRVLDLVPPRAFFYLFAPHPNLMQCVRKRRWEALGLHDKLARPTIPTASSQDPSHELRLFSISHRLVSSPGQPKSSSKRTNRSGRPFVGNGVHAVCPICTLPRTHIQATPHQRLSVSRTVRLLDKMRLTPSTAEGTYRKCRGTGRTNTVRGARVPRSQRRRRGAQAKHLFVLAKFFACRSSEPKA